LAELKDYAFANRESSKYIRTNYRRDTMIPYHEYMFLSFVFNFNQYNMPARNIQEGPLLQARGMFPEDLWSLYWLGFSATEKKQWSKGLMYFQELFADDLSYSMESLPLAYQKPPCARKKRATASSPTSTDALQARYTTSTTLPLIKTSIVT